MAGCGPYCTIQPDPTGPVIIKPCNVIHGPNEDDWPLFRYNMRGAAGAAAATDPGITYRIMTSPPQVYQPPPPHVYQPPPPQVYQPPPPQHKTYQIVNQSPVPTQSVYVSPVPSPLVAPVSPAIGPVVVDTPVVVPTPVVAVTQPTPPVAVAAPTVAAPTAPPFLITGNFPPPAEPQPLDVTFNVPEMRVVRVLPEGCPVFKVYQP